MAVFSMTDILALMPQADTVVTIDGAVFTVPATVPFTTSAGFIDVPGGTVLAVMRTGRTPTNGKHLLQCFSIDEIVTVT